MLDFYDTFYIGTLYYSEEMIKNNITTYNFVKDDLYKKYKINNYKQLIVNKDFCELKTGIKLNAIILDNLKESDYENQESFFKDCFGYNKKFITVSDEEYFNLFLLIDKVFKESIDTTKFNLEVLNYILKNSTKEIKKHISEEKKFALKYEKKL